MEKTYWNSLGKYQDEVDRINKLVPSRSRTDNRYMNLFLVASNLYYDMYNNDGCNISY